MKKKYTRCSASLFIGLLSLHTLSSCVNTGQTLGMSHWAKKMKEDEQKLDKKTHMLVHIPPDHSKYPHCWYCKPWYVKHPYKAAAGITTTALVGAGLFYYYMLSGSDLMEGTAANATTALAPTVETGVANMTNTTLASIGQAAETAAVTITTLLPTAGLIASLRPNGWNSNSSVATSFIPDYSVTPITKHPEDLVNKGGASDRVNDPMVLDHQITSDLNKNFSAARIQHWLDNGLNIHAKDDKGRNLLMIAAGKGNLESVQFIIKEGLNVNEQNNDGSTALHYAINNIDNINTTESIVKDLLNHGIDPCIKNKANKKAIDYISNAQNTIKDKVTKDKVTNVQTLLSEASEQCKQDA